VAKDGLNRTRVFGGNQQVAFICRVVEVWMAEPRVMGEIDGSDGRLLRQWEDGWEDGSWEVSET
jgi:hypothetical protein